MRVLLAQDEREWERFLQDQPWSPFLQSWTMGEVYREVGEELVRLMVVDNEERKGGMMGICQTIVVNARRGRHLAVPYGPVTKCKVESDKWKMTVELLIGELRKIAREKGCAFVRMSPFWRFESVQYDALKQLGFRPAPLHMLAEHVWYLDLVGKSEEGVFMGMRKTTRNLIRRAEREGVTVEVSTDPKRDLPQFFALYEETRKRHRFVPYPNDFISAQVMKFYGNDQCALYLARYRGDVIAASVHMVYGGETSYHHGASSMTHPKCYASYALQWRAIQDALRRGDRVYNFWGVSPEGVKNHPFAGVRTFKTGFGGELLELARCMDAPVSWRYWLTWCLENGRRWKRGF